MKIILAGIFAFILTVVLGALILPLLRRWKFGQSIREEGPKSHLKKAGTPTVGGVFFIPAVLAAALCFFPDPKTLLVCVASLLFGLIGLADDALIIARGKNLGLTAKQKLLLQILASAVLVVWALYGIGIDTVIRLPFGFSFTMPLWLYIPAVLFMTVGMTNASNLTDGIDGLASSVVLVIAVFMGVLCFRLNLTEGAGFAAAVAGGCAGFLVYNAHPAKVFMGDTGSIFLGGALTALSVVYGLEIFWLIAAAVMLWETLSVMIQVTSFKLTGKRVFKMSPFHHHLEHCGWGEWKIVGTFSAVTLILCALLLLTL